MLHCNSKIFFPGILTLIYCATLFLFHFGEVNTHPLTISVLTDIRSLHCAIICGFVNDHGNASFKRVPCLANLQIAYCSISLPGCRGTFHIILVAELYTTCPGERVLVATKFNVTFLPLRLCYVNTSTCF